MIKIRVEIISIDENVVEVSTGYGILSGLWNGEIPKTNDIREVEIEIEDTQEWNEDITPTESKEYKCGMSDGKIFIIGYLETVEDDGYTVIRFGESIISVDTEGESFIVGEYVKLILENIEFYDVAI